MPETLLGGQAQYSAASLRDNAVASSELMAPGGGASGGASAGLGLWLSRCGLASVVV